MQPGEVTSKKTVAGEMVLRAGAFRYVFPRPALVMGILNVTPDSFSDGGRYIDPEKAVAHGLEMAETGADVLDIGGESTRPGAVPVPEEEELRRVLPVIKSLAKAVTIPISIDTMKPVVARAAIGAGASIINDVAANRTGEEMWRLAAETGAAYVCMHMRGTPQTMHQDLRYENVVREVGDFLSDRIDRLNHCGVAAEQVIVDPGIGFGKGLGHNLRLLGGLRAFTRFGRPLMIGVSRKSFIEKLLGAKPGNRLPGSLACACLAVAAGANIVRVHDVSESVQAVRMSEAILSTST